MAAVEMRHYTAAGRAADRARASTPAQAMEPFVAALETYHSLTEPSTWLESVVKAYVGDGMAADFYREVAEFVDADTRALIHEVLADAGRAEFAVREVRARDRAAAVGGRPARAVGPAAGRRGDQPDPARAGRPRRADAAADAGGGDLSGVAGLIGRITDRHDERMAALGLSS